jgi:hypothetical protein
MGDGPSLSWLQNRTDHHQWYHWRDLVAKCSFQTDLKIEFVICNVNTHIHVQFWHIILLFVPLDFPVFLRTSFACLLNFTIFCTIIFSKVDQNPSFILIILFWAMFQWMLLRWANPSGYFIFCTYQNKQRVCHTLALPFTLKIKLRQKTNYENSNISPCKNIIFKKKSSKRNKNPSTYYNFITNLKFQHKPKYHVSKKILI